MSKPNVFERLIEKFEEQTERRKMRASFRAMAARINENKPEESQKPVIFFDASTRLDGVSLNAGFAIVTAWSLALQGVPVVHFVCQEGLRPCIHGTDRNNPDAKPPCRSCIRQSEALFAESKVSPFNYRSDSAFEEEIQNLDLAQLMVFEYRSMPLGELSLPAIRWIMRRHHLTDDDYTRSLFKNYLRSAWSLAQQFEVLLDEQQPQAVVVFNGLQYPEAVARWLARRRGIKVFSHEVGMLPITAYFTEGDATAYDLDIPQDFQLNEIQDEKLNRYLNARFKGDFHMAGVQFWPEMSELSPEFLAYAKKFKQMVPVFTNVIFDTSQPHANVLFEDMFVWLDSIVETAKKHPETLFVIRAHPDEAREGKASEESVAQWAEKRQIEHFPNIRFVPPKEYINSYDLIRMSKFVLIYNSTIGMEASILGAGVLSAGKARYTASDVVWFPQSIPAYQEKLEDLLNAEQIEVPEKFKVNAKRFLYYQLHRSALRFEAFLEPDGIWAGYVKLKEFSPAALLPEHSKTMQVISDGILRGGNFMYQEDL